MSHNVPSERSSAHPPRRVAVAEGHEERGTEMSTDTHGDRAWLLGEAARERADAEKWRRDADRCVQLNLITTAEGKTRIAEAHDRAAARYARIAGALGAGYQCRHCATPYTGPVTPQERCQRPSVWEYDGGRGVTTCGGPLVDVPNAPARAVGKENERRESDRMRRAVIATCKGCLAAALGEPLHAVAKSGYQPRTLEGDSWENGWQFVAESAAMQGRATPTPAMVERAAREINNATFNGQSDKEWERASEPRKQHFRTVARAALAAALGGPADHAGAGEARGEMNPTGDQR